MIESRGFWGRSIAAQTGASTAARHLRRRGGDFHRQRRLARAHVDDDTARPAAGQHTIGPENDLADVGRIADHGEDDIGSGGHGTGAIGPTAPAASSGSAFALPRVVHGGGKACAEEVPHMLAPITPVPIEPTRVVLASMSMQTSRGIIRG